MTGYWRKKGIVLLVSTLGLSIMMVVAMMMVRALMVQRAVVGSAGERVQAQLAAEAGMALQLAQIQARYPKLDSHSCAATVYTDDALPKSYVQAWRVQVSCQIIYNPDGLQALLYLTATACRRTTQSAACLSIEDPLYMEQSVSKVVEWVPAQPVKPVVIS